MLRRGERDNELVYLSLLSSGLRFSISKSLIRYVKFKALFTFLILLILP